MSRACCSPPAARLAQHRAGPRLVQGPAPRESGVTPLAPSSTGSVQPVRGAGKLGHVVLRVATTHAQVCSSQNFAARFSFRPRPLSGWRSCAQGPTGLAGPMDYAWSRYSSIAGCRTTASSRSSNRPSTCGRMASASKPPARPTTSTACRPTPRNGWPRNAPAFQQTAWWFAGGAGGARAGGGDVFFAGFAQVGLADAGARSPSGAWRTARCCAARCPARPACATVPRGRRQRVKQVQLLQQPALGIARRRLVGPGTCGQKRFRTLRRRSCSHIFCGCFNAALRNGGIP